ncbi:phage tail assembly protein [Pedomonas mirosovicensis]|uniref:phage tail assembly protein n=1 Tax=Pedomonas mirosovicensis TaxID=2908641 RepID=UPI0021685F09|nr:phage tail assembly protein [Pedomonas mirosovicensis]MCH8686454.1 phage tail assembly protein [Pedomonas mirosovicensis]
MTEFAEAMNDTATRTVTLDRPLVRGEQTLETIQVRRPKAGELRGLNLRSLSELDYAALETLLPRITTPMLTKQDVAELDPSDLMQMGTEVVDFLLPKRIRAALPQA